MPATIGSFDVAAFATMSLQVHQSTIDPTATQLATVSLTQRNLTREGAEGEQYLVASMTIVDPIDGARVIDQVAAGLNVSFASGNTAVTQVMSGNMVTALGSGTAHVTGVLSHGGMCGSAADQQSSSPAVVTVELPAATSAYLADDSGTPLTAVKVAHHSDAAFFAGQAPREQRIRVMAVYPEYTRDLTDDPRTTVLNPPSNPFTIGPCIGSAGLCIHPNASVAATGTLAATFAHEAVDATATVEVIQGTSLDIVPRPYPSWPGSDSVTKAELSMIGSTGAHQRATL